jgi:N-acetylglucosaminyl-diphospho-decaprenol L-rhamnosyltransferase
VSAADDIGVVVVTHRSAETIDDCLLRLRGTAGVAAILVIDNASDDSTLSIVQRHAANDVRVRFVANPDNPGFAVACNQGVFAFDAAAASAITWLAFVNPDCLVEPDSLAHLRTHARQLDGNALIGADLVGEDGTRDPAARRRDPDFKRMLGVMWHSPAAARLEVPIDVRRSLQQVDVVSGALKLLPRILFARIGGFDVGYRLHAEDLDICRRARDAGAVVAVANDVRVLHVRGVSSRSRPLFVEWHKHRGLWRWFRKFEAKQHGLPTQVAVFLLIWARFPLAAARAFARR